MYMHLRGKSVTELLRAKSINSRTKSRAVLSIGQKGQLPRAPHVRGAPMSGLQTWYAIPCTGQTRLIHLTVMSMESDILRGLDLTEVIHQFPLRKARKVIL